MYTKHYIMSIKLNGVVMLTKKDCFRILKVKNSNQLAKKLNLTRQTISTWGEEVGIKNERLVLGQMVLDKFETQYFISILEDL